MDYVNGAMLPVIKWCLPEGDHHVSENEFIKWLGMWLVMGCYEGNWSRQDLWSKDDIRIRRGSPFCLNECTSRVKFEQIPTRLKYTYEEPPHYLNRFFHVRKLVEAWNANMSANFFPGLISFSDKSMMIWENKFGPGWVVLPRKPHPFGNKWHTICCAMSVLVFFVEFVERKDLPKEKWNPDIKTDYGTAGRQMTQMTNALFDTRKAVAIDRTFCVLKGIVRMLVHGEYRTTMINVFDQVLQGICH